MPLRVPLAQNKTMSLSFGSSWMREPISGSGMLMLPGALPIANSPADRTSMNTALFCRNSGNRAATRLERHAL